MNIKGKSEIKYMTIKNMPVGTRFMYGSHSSFMIKTDYKTKSLRSTTYLAVSESGLSEFIPDTMQLFTCFKGVKEGVISLINSVKHNHFKDLTFGITPQNKIGKTK
ncbi:MAG TPA: hypothetical protein VNX68_11795 [Nitrosopumilaceae archaeon]|jgi:hypothetical protein|nr:hypothetical protein [Nitrosopumilaceae archaeon]